MSKLRRKSRIKKLDKRQVTKIKPSPLSCNLHQKDLYKILITFDGLQSNLVMDDFSCPFCYQSFILLNQLAFHLTFTHFRFSYKITLDEQNKCVRILVCSNKEFDTTDFSTKMKHLYQMTTMFLKGLNTQTLSRMFIYNSRYKTFTIDLSPINIFESMNRQRLLYHSQTWLPITPAELDDDSDDCEPNWYAKLKRAVSKKFFFVLFDKFFLIKSISIQMIYEFIDVNEGEKEMMILWNTFMFENR